MEGQLSNINTSSVTSRFQGTEDNKPDVGETKLPCASSRVEEINSDKPDAQDTEYDSDGTSKKMQMDGDDEPKLGMKFNSLEDLMSYYKECGKKCGFGVMTKSSERGEDETVRYVTLACACGGKARNRILNVANSRPTGKTEYINDLASIRMNRSFRSLVVGAGGFENLPFLENGCRNYIEKAKHLRLGAGGAGALQDYFLRMQYKNIGFFALMDLDDDGRLKNVFWADPHSRVAYQYFGDVVTFDITYLMNRYKMPFAPFVGVNYQGQSILLGAGLISSEDTETFMWLFQTWL
ncbi:protein FAR1-RELATED SEQUENCE 3-like [Carya illinoinensis]|uniref:protein FAR1-RELATED SEQUENCE 3-like n=1 Tax=Carya illinoinensis TaxID=32201 RepID=UPI001C719ADB|nr:protein FAR1-RELATED SEQUENCE 3-like [Carya illinoinensis]